MKVRPLRSPTVKVTFDAYKHIQALVSLAEKEVGWLGKVLINPENPLDLTITDIYLIEQEVSAAETNIDPVALGEFYANHEDIASDIKFWGHSHVNMHVSPSGQDTAQMEEFLENGAQIFIMGIFNKKGDVRFDVYTPFTVFEDVEWFYHIQKEFMNDVKTEFDKLVSEQEFISYSHNQKKKSGKQWWEREFEWYDRYDY